jgi:hypothetical protein
VATPVTAVATAVTEPTTAVSIENERAARNRLIPSYRETLDPEKSVSAQALGRMREVAITWWSLFEAIRESDSHVAERKGTLPAWARELIGTYSQQHAAHDEFTLWAGTAKKALNIAEGSEVEVYEVWTKNGHRLDGQHAFWADADARRDALKAKFPDAYVCRLHPKRPIIYPDSPDLLDTLIGSTFWCGVSFGDGDEEDLHTVQDSTGRTVTVPTSVLVSHEAFQRMSADGQQQLAVHQACAQRRQQRRAEAQGE